MPHVGAGGEQGITADVYNNNHEPGQRITRPQRTNNGNCSDSDVSGSMVNLERLSRASSSSSASSIISASNGSARPPSDVTEPLYGQPMSNQARDTKLLESQNVAPSVDGDDVVDYNISESEAHSSDSSIPPVVRNLEIVHRTGVSTIATRGWQDTTALHKEASTRGRNPKVSLTDVLLNAEHSRMYHEVATSKSKNGRANRHGRISSSWDSLCGVMGTSSSLVAFQNKRTQLKRLTYTSITTFHKELIIYRNKLRDPVDVKMLDEDWALRLVRDPTASAMRGNWKSSASSLTKEQKEKKASSQAWTKPSSYE